MAAAQLPIELAGRRIGVVGLGRSGWAAVEWLLARGARVRAFEDAPPHDLAARWAARGDARAELVIGGRPAEAAGALGDCALLVRSPGVPADHPLVVAARGGGVPVVSEIELAAAGVTTAVLAVTGTNGKSTTTAWAAHLLEHAGIAAVACGNIGHPFSTAARETPAATFVVEVSSFQLEDCPTFHPRAATILNISPDHLDRHGTYTAYAEAKWALTRNQDRDDLLALGPGLLAAAAGRSRARTLLCDPVDRGASTALFVHAGGLWWRDREDERCLLPVGELALPGQHNQVNAMAAFALAASVTEKPARLLPGLRDFPGLPHRLEPAGEVGGVVFVNDSKATNVDSLRVALQSFADPVVLIAGGRDKQGTFESIAALVGERVRHLVAIGEAAARIRAAYPEVPAETAPSLEAAVQRALASTGGSGVVLLSPGCASFDMFRDYRDRGEQFKALVRALQGADAPAPAGGESPRRR
ncbi:MAG: UDP-N-acetylmuramoyl-L-alanine--D-glutamate ligase [Candidatus Eisenbacteria sp.]|nr:UDP-N-acetylmuramoyl-L-alanine--D-glutamate ligase [Candidatus Eisenbacteria bacterium]